MSLFLRAWHYNSSLISKAQGFRIEVGHLSRSRLAYSSGTMRREIGVNFAQVFAAAALLFLSEHEIKGKERPGNPNNMYAIFLSPLLLVFSCYILAGARINISLFIKGTRRRILNGTLNPRALVTSNAALSPSLSLSHSLSLSLLACLLLSATIHSVFLNYYYRARL